MLRREQRGHIHSRRFHYVDVAFTIAVQARVIGNQSDPLAFERLKFLRRQHIEAGLRLAIARDLATESRAGLCLVVSREHHRLRIHPQRRRRDCRHFGSQRRDGRPARRMHAVGQQDHVRFGIRVHPDGGACESRVAVGADREQLAAITGKRRVDVPAEPAQDRLIGRTLRRGELVDRERAKQTHASQRALVQHHFTEPCQVIGGRKHSRVPCYAAHEARRVIVHHAAQHVPILQPLGGRYARAQRRRRIEHRLFHAQRSEDAIARVLVERLPAQPVHQLAQQNKIDVAIDETRARRTGGFIDGSQVDTGLIAAPGRVKCQVGS